MPDKHIQIGESLLGLSSHVIELLTLPQTIDELWASFRELMDHGGYPAEHSFENLVLAVDVLFALGAVKEVDHLGMLQRCT